MHPFFRIEELVQRIFRRYSTDSELATLALVQQGLGSIALDILWEDVDINVLGHLFPLDVVKSLDTTTKLEFIQAPRKSDWERFAIYSPRIRTLRRTRWKRKDFSDTTPVMDSSLRNEMGNALFFLRHYPSGTPFPNLQHLDWRGASGYELPELPTLFVPSLHTVDLSDVFKGKLNPSRLSFNTAIQVPLRTLADLSPSLRKISMPIPDISIDDQLETEYLAACSSLMMKGLVDVTVPISVGLLSVLSGLQTLKTLKLQFSPGGRTSTAVENFNRWLDEPNTPGADECTITSFPQLKTLRIQSAPSLRIATSLIVKACCYPVERISIQSRRSPNHEEFSQLIEHGLHSSCSTSLREFSLTTVLSYNGWGEVHDEDGSLWPGFEGTRITVDHLQPLLNFHVLEVLKIDLRYTLGFTNTQLKDFVFDFPFVTELSICPCLDSFPVRHISPRELAALSSHPRLQKLGVHLSVTKEDLQLPLIARSEHDSPLTVLDVGNSSIPNHCVAVLALFLVHHFPNINEILWNGNESHRPSLWSEVLEGLESARTYCSYYRMLGRTPESS